MLSSCRRTRPHVLKSRGRRLSISGTKPEKMHIDTLRKELERVLPHLIGAPLRELVYEYWKSGEPATHLRVMFRYYP